MERRADKNGLGWMDGAAILLSGLCLIHCATSAVIVALLATTGGALFGHGVHEIGLAFALMLGVAALGTGLCRHGAVLPAVIGAVGLALMGFALTQPHGPAEMGFTMAGVMILAVAHWLNRRAAAAALA